MYQLNNVGIPYEKQIKNSDDVIYIHSYKRDDGTKVKAHYRSKRDGVKGNNLLNGRVEYNKDNINREKININPFLPYNPYSLAQTIEIFSQNKQDMDNANVKNSDKYFHSKANFQSAQNGALIEALILDIGKEIFDLAQKNHLKKNGQSYNANLNDSLQDLQADFYGLLQGLINPNTNYKNSLKKYRVNGIDEKY